MRAADMEHREKRIQEIKNILIAVLFISAVLLLSFFWKDISLNDLSSLTLGLQSEDTYKPELSELTRPGQIEVSFGSGIYTVISADWDPEAHGIYLDTDKKSKEDYKVSGAIDASAGSDDSENNSENNGNAVGASARVQRDINYSDDSEQADDSLVRTRIYEYLIYVMEQYLSKEDIRQEKIEASQYEEVMSYPSVTAAFAFNIPFVDFLGNNGIEAPQGSGDIINVTEISFSAASSENLFIYDASDFSYYRFVTQDQQFAEGMSEELSKLIKGIEDSGITPYYTIENLAGINNDTLIPLYQQGIQDHVECRSEFSINSDSEIRKYEQMFFPSGMDFVRKITENKGSLLYTYGYNEKVLLLDETGRISYTEELDPSYYSEIDFYDGLNEAVEYVTTHGGWSQMNGEKMVPYLSNVVKVKSGDDKYTGYRYEFSVKLKGIPVFFSSGSMLSVEIYGSQITSYQRDIVMLSKKGNQDTEDIEVINAIDVITEEYDEIGKIAAANARENGNEEKAALYLENSQFENVTKNIELIRFCLLRNIDKDPSVFVPAWYIKLDGIKFWCSHDDGHIITWSIAEEK